MTPEETAKNCELCGEASDLDFHCLFPSFGIMVKGNLCLKCLSSADDDMRLAAELLKRRAETRGVPLPVGDAETLAGLAEPTP